MRIVYFGTYWTGYGGTEFDIRTMLTHIARRGYKCIHIGYSGPAGSSARQPFEQEGVDVIYFEGVSTNSAARMRQSQAAALAKLKEVLTSDDILITIFLPEVEAWKVARAAGARVIQKYTIVEDGVDPTEWEGLVDLHIFNSESCRDTWQERGLEGFNMVIYPEIDIKIDFEKYSAECGYIGMLNPSRHKGVEIFEDLARAFRDERFLAAGGWSIRKEGYSSKDSPVEYLGHVENIAEFYSKIKVLLVPTQKEHTETYGRMVLEAMCYGVPVIASNKDGIPEAAGDAAMLVESYDRLQGWMDALHEMLKPETLKEYHEKSKARAVRYDLVKIISLWEVAFTVLGGNNVEVINSDRGPEQKGTPS